MTKTFHALVAGALLWAGGNLEACTNILVTKGASKDGSVMITYAADSHNLYGELYYRPAGQHLPGTFRPIVDWDGGKPLGKIPEAPVTYARVGNINEHQVAIGETTFGGRKECQKANGIIDYGSLIYIALERSKTAREAIQVMTKLVEEYGYASSGESFSIADPNEAWILDLIGKGEKGKGAVWVAMKLPDGTISAHANQARIRQFPLNDPQNCLYAKDVISFAKANGWYKGEDKDFNFADTYARADYGALRFCEARVWSVFRRAAPSLKISSDYVKGEPNAQPMPLWVKPDQKLSVHDTMELMRDHYEGTEFDMSKDVGAGPYALPYRWRPMQWKVGETEYLHERAISTQQTGFSFVTQSRSWLPNPIGGIIWFGMDDTYSTVYVPMYCGIREVPKSWGAGSGSFAHFSWNSAFWVFNFVTNWAYGRYSDMIQDIQVVQRELEGKFFYEQPEVEAQALKLHQSSPNEARAFLTSYSVSQGEMVTERWKKLGEHLIWKYIDGNVRHLKGDLIPPTHPPYSESWYKRIIQEKGDSIKMKKLPGEESH